MLRYNGKHGMLLSLCLYHVRLALRRPDRYTTSTLQEKKEGGAGNIVSELNLFGCMFLNNSFQKKKKKYILDFPHLSPSRRVPTGWADRKGVTCALLKGYVNRSSRDAYQGLIFHVFFRSSPTRDPDLIPNLIGRVVSCVSNVFGRLGSVCRRQTTEQDEDEEHGRAEDDDLPQSRPLGAEFRPMAAGLAGIVLERLISELEVDHAAQGDRVPEELQTRYGRAPDAHRGADEQDILENSTEGEDQNRRLADLRAGC